MKDQRKTKAQLIVELEQSRRHIAELEVMDNRSTLREKRHSEREERFRDIFENSPIGIYRTTPEGRILMANPVLVNMLGYASFEDIARRHLEEEGYHPEYPRSRFKQQMETQGYVKGLESAWIRKDGSVLFLRENARAVRDDNGNIVYYDGTVEDITERKQAEKALRDSEEKFRNLVDNTIDWVWQVDWNGTYTYVSPNVLQIMGYREDEIIGKKPFDLMSSEEAQRIACIFQEIAGRKERIVALEDTLLHKNGYPVIFETNATPLLDDHGDLIGYFGTCRDITDRKVAEETLRASEERYRFLFERNLAAVYRTTLDGRILDCNHSFAQLLGYDSPEEVKKHRASEFYFNKKDRESLVRQVKKNCTLTNFETRLRKKDGSPIWLLENISLLVEVDGQVIVQGTAIDITERKRAEDALEQKIIELNSFINNIPDMAWLKDTNSNFIAANRAFGEAVGMDPEYLVNHTCEVCFGKEASQKFREDDQRVMESRKQTVIEEIIKDAHGNEVYLETIKSPILNESGDVVGTVGIARDITERKLVEKALKESEEKYRDIVELAPEGILTFDLKGIVTSCNDSFLRITGFSKDEIVGRHLSKLSTLRVKDIPKYMTLLSSMVMGKIPKPFEFEWIHKDGTKRWGEAHFNLMKRGRERIGLLAILIDITERKKAEETLKESEEKYRLLVENANECIIVAQDGMVKLANPKMSEISSYSNEELTSKSFVEFLHPADREMVMQHHVRRLQGEETPMNYTLRAVTKSGGIKWLENNGVIIDWEGKPATLNFLTDITDRKEAEDQLRFLSSISEQVSDSIITTDVNFQITYINKAAEELFGYRREELIGQSPYILNAEPLAEEIQNEIYRIVGLGESYSGTWLNRRKDGTTFFCEVKVSPMRDETGQTYGYIGIQRDVTDQRRAEERLQTYQNQLRSVASKLSLTEEKERRFLATQLHDGIGQSLAVTKVKLGALKKEMEETGLTGSIDDIQNIIEQTIQDARTLTFDLSPPILYELGFEPAVEWLTDQIQERHGIQTKCEDDMCPKPLEDDIRVVLFQAVRELIYNIVKHARAQHIEVSLQRVGNLIRICVNDDGIGFDTSILEEPEPKERSFGLFNIRERLDHLGGHLELESKPNFGTKATLFAPLHVDVKE